MSIKSLRFNTIVSKNLHEYFLIGAWRNCKIDSFVPITISTTYGLCKECCYLLGIIPKSATAPCTQDKIDCFRAVDLNSSCMHNRANSFPHQNLIPVVLDFAKRQIRCRSRNDRHLSTSMPLKDAIILWVPDNLQSGSVQH